MVQPFCLVDWKGHTISSWWFQLSFTPIWNHQPPDFLYLQQTSNQHCSGEWGVSHRFQKRFKPKNPRVKLVLYEVSITNDRVWITKQLHSTPTTHEISFPSTEPPHFPACHSQLNCGLCAAHLSVPEDTGPAAFVKTSVALRWNHVQ